MKENMTSPNQVSFLEKKGFVFCVNFLVSSLCLSAFAAFGADYTLKSPAGKISVTVRTDAHLNYAVSVRGKPVLETSALGITVDGKDLGQGAKFVGKPQVAEINERYATRGVHASAVNHCTSAVISMTGSAEQTPWVLEVRVFDDAVAYRYRVPGNGVRHVNGESSEWLVPVGTVLWSQNADNSSYEARYTPNIVGQLPKNLKIMAPATLKFPNGLGYGMMSEANLVAYSDMSLEAVGTNCFQARFQYDREGWDLKGEILSPWRVTLLAADLNTLVNSDAIKNLCPAPAPELVNAPWIRPGRSIWHWLTGGAPKLAEQKGWIDGTKKIGYDYYLVDDGWRDWNGGGDNAWKALEEIVQYAKSQGVDIWAWVGASYVHDPKDRETYFKKAKSIGLVGLKIDFPNAPNLEWVNWYEETLRNAAAHQLMVDFHGAVKPTGRERTWPHEMTREGISGREQGKNPTVHDTTLPFLRYVQGHADYTPTLLIPDRLNGSTFAHELSMAVVFTSPYLCMGDNPKRYLESQAEDVLKALPATWDETIVLPGSEAGEMAAFARRQGNQWFVGVINGSTPHREAYALNFLGKGAYKLIELADDPDRLDAFARSERTVTRKDVLTIPARKDGGYVAWLVPVPGLAAK